MRSEVVPNSLGIMVATLASYGFIEKSFKGGNLSLQGNLEVDGVVFDLIFSRLDPTFSDIPAVHLAKIPDGIRRRLPHIERGLELCYLDPDTVILDPYQPQRTTDVIVGCLIRLLSTFVNPTEKYIRNEFAGEFYSYWESEVDCFLTTTQKNSVGFFYERDTVVGTLSHEIGIVSDESEISLWEKIRNANPVKKSRVTVASIVLKLKNSPLVNDELPEWPISSWEGFLAWLASFDRDAEQSLMSNLHLALKNDRAVAIILLSETTGPFGVYVSFKNEVRKRIKVFDLSRNRSKSRNKGRLVGLREFREFISKNQKILNFKRVRAYDVTESFIIDRNLRLESLRDFKIAVIGCGTIGGYAADLLVKAGAGCGAKGVLSLFDGDRLGSGNIGRHILGFKYLREPKSYALAHYIEELMPFKVNVSAGYHLPVDLCDQLDGYDLVIDLTGDENYSTRLSHRTQRLRLQGKQVPDLLHFWIDAGGRAVRGLLDDGTTGCYRCLRTYKGSGVDPFELDERFPLFSTDIGSSRDVRVLRCGDSYIPFPAGYSEIAAGHVQIVALNHLTGQSQDSFFHYSLDKDVRKTKSQKLKKMDCCPCCQ